MPLKILLAGSVDGQIEQLFQRVSAVNAKSGPFDVLFCVGTFFKDSGEPAEDEAGDLAPELAAYMTGEKQAPVPTFFIGGHGKGAKPAIAGPEAGRGNVWYMGGSGVRDVRGLKVAFLDGTYDGIVSTQPAEGTTEGPWRHYSKTAVESLLETASKTTDVDFFFSCEWPRRIARGVPAAGLTEEVSKHSDGGVPQVARLAEALRPRYHIASGPFWQRHPYLNRDMGAGAPTTRFISLAPVGNKNKQRFLHALQVTPASEMDPDALLARTPDTTMSPYEGLTKREAEEEVDRMGDHTWRWTEKKQKTEHAQPSKGKAGVIRDHTRTIFIKNLPFSAAEEDVVDFFSKCGKVEDYRRSANAEGKLNSWALLQFTEYEAAAKACTLNGAKLMGREIGIDMAQGGARNAGKPVEGCWFCLSNPNCSSWLLVSIGQESYVSMDKSPIDRMHVQIIPIEHFPSTMMLPESTHHEMERYFGALRSMYAQEGKEPLMFERHLTLRKAGGNHVQVNMVPISREASSRAKAYIEAMGQQIGIRSFEVFQAEAGEKGRAEMRKHVGDMEFISFTLPDGMRLVHVIRPGERHPVSFVREVAAALAGKPDKADWRKCELGRDGEERAAEALRERFSEFDIMAN